MFALATGCLTALALAGCSLPVAEQAPVVPAPLPAASVGYVWTLGEWDATVFDALPGDRIDYEMVDDEGMVERCAGYGGTLIWSSDEVTSAHWVCQGVDF